MSDNIVCPGCHGKGTVYDQVQWSDGLGVVTCTCHVCEGSKEIPRDLLGPYLTERSKARKLAQELLELRRHVHMFISTMATPYGEGDGDPVPGFPGASPHASTWLEYLEREAAIVADAEVLRLREIADAEHAKYHNRPAPDHPCPATNARHYCVKCHPTHPYAVAPVNTLRPKLKLKGTRKPYGPRKRKPGEVTTLPT